MQMPHATACKLFTLFEMECGPRASTVDGNRKQWQGFASLLKSGAHTQLSLATRDAYPLDNSVCVSACQACDHSLSCLPKLL